MPNKLRQLPQFGIVVTGRAPHVVPPKRYNEFDRRTKAEKSGHPVDFDGREHPPEQHDRPLVPGTTAEQVAAIQPP